MANKNKPDSKFNRLKRNLLNPDRRKKQPFVTKNRKEYETKKLEKKQTGYLNAQWKKVQTLFSNKVIQYEAQRYPSYYDYDNMDKYPLIGQALDIIMEESTTLGDDGKMLNIYSEDKRVQTALNDLFNNRLNIHTNLPMWIRGMAKYGDNFVYLRLDDEDGVMGCKLLPVGETERIEPDTYGSIRSYLSQDDNETIFRWNGAEYADFKYYQIAHFRLLADGDNLPYGTSTLEKARRLWRNLILEEDAMRTIRLMRAMDRRIYYVNVGNINPTDVDAYIQKIANQFKRKRHVDPETGQEDLKYNIMGYDQDFIIPRRDKDDGTKIETLAGASNIDQIADIEYSLNLMFAALGIPKPFLQYSDTAGDGKNLSLQDVRFARKISRIQQAALHELNKIAIIHLHLIGLEEAANDFELSLNNPSTQSEMMKQELMTTKISTYKEAVTPIGESGIAPMSVTKAMKEILGFTEVEIKLNMEQQYLERAAGAELKLAGEVIKDSKIFDKPKTLYGEFDLSSSGDTETATTESGGDFGGGAAGGDFGLGGGDLDAEIDDALDVEEEGDIGGDLDIGDETDTEEPTETGEEVTDVGESFNNHRSDKLIIETDKSKRVLQIIRNMDKK